MVGIWELGWAAEEVLMWWSHLEEGLAGERRRG